MLLEKQAHLSAHIRAKLVEEAGVGGSWQGPKQCLADEHAGGQRPPSAPREGSMVNLLYVLVRGDPFAWKTTMPLAKTQSCNGYMHTPPLLLLSLCLWLSLANTVWPGSLRFWAKGFSGVTFA